MIYDQLVRARVCRSSGFGSIKNGFGGIYVTVTPTAITVTAGGPGGKVVRLLGIEYILDPKATQMTRRRVGVMETNLFGRESVVIKGEDRKGELEIAIVPRDGDLERLERALIDVGASAGE